MNDSLYGFRADFAADTGHKSLVLTRPGLARSQITGYQVEMIAHNKINGIVPFYLQENNNFVEIVYNLNQNSALANFLKRQRLDKTEFAAMLSSIVATLLNSNNYFLDDTSFILDQNYIYINPKTRAVSLVYVPMEISRDTAQCFKTFLVDLLVNSTGVEAGEDFTRQALSLVKNEDFNLPGFREWLTCADHPVPEGRMTTVEQPASGSQPINESKLQPGSELDGQVKGGKPFAEIKKLKLTRKRILFGLAVLSVSAALAANSGEILNIVRNKQVFLWLIQFRYIWAGAVLLVAGLVLAWMHFSRTGRPSQETGKLTEGVFNELEVEIENCPEPAQYVPESDETVLLCETTYPLLKAVDGSQTVIITKPDFVIGRNRETCDYALQTRSIGRAHALIKNINGTYYIVDLDSQNGTFVNEDRLVSNKEYELKNNDRVALANMDFLFKLI